MIGYELGAILVSFEALQEALQDILFGCGKRAIFGGDVIICLLELQYNIVWVGKYNTRTHIVIPNVLVWIPCY